MLGLYAAPRRPAPVAPRSSAVSTHEGLEYPNVSATASLAAGSLPSISPLCNTDPVAPVEIELTLTGRPLGLQAAHVLATPAAAPTCNTFDEPRGYDAAVRWCADGG